MNKIIRILAICLFFACNNSADSTKDAKDSSGSNATASWPKDKENELLDGCIETLQTEYGMAQDSAFTYCNCVVKQLKGKYSDIDSATTVMQDSTQAAPFVQQCR